MKRSKMNIDKKYVCYKNNGYGFNNMVPSEITIHNTYNTTATNERNYVQSSIIIL